MAQLYFKYGAMGSSKTANALMARFNYEERGQETLLVKPRLDTRDGDHMVYSRIGLKHPCIYFDEMRAMPEDELKKYACIIIDEAQFLTKEEVYYLVHLVDDCNIPVICYGLRADFKGDLFPGSYHLLVLAARWIFLKDEYGMSSRYEIQYQMGIVGILLTFALVWSMCREKAQETEADKAKTRAPEKRAVRTPLKVCMLAFTVLTVFGNAWTTRAEIRTAPYRKAYLQVSRELGLNYRTASDEDLETYLHNDPDAVRDAMRILEENHLNIFR